MEEIRKQVLKKALNEYRELNNSTIVMNMFDAHELSNKKDFIFYIKDKFNIQTLEILNMFEYPLSFLYDTWIDIDDCFFEEKYKLIENKILS
ncbi:hypothetical protein [Anaerofustis butyriciformans]|uniref:hypothetical protein n=1 Tax=Anaerofustis butyriciformans TaxID=3108533 RepID=UPI002E2F7896|nr:hypothetical protein [Anaerofustis sp. HA2171]